MESDVTSTGSNRRIGAERKNGLESAPTQTRPFRWLRQRAAARLHLYCTHRKPKKCKCGCVEPTSAVYRQT